MDGDCGEDNSGGAADHRVCQTGAGLHGPVTGRPDHVAESRYTSVFNSSRLKIYSDVISNETSRERDVAPW